METHNTKIDNSTTASAFRPMGELSRIDYVGPCVYEDGELKRITIPGGYIDVDGEELKYRFFINDHQGNVRAVIDQQGNLLEANDYYPYGQPLPSATSSSIQPYKFAGKERLSMWGSGGATGKRSNALQSLSDFGPRWLNTATASWTVPDPMAELYPSVSPYAYCAANPIRYTDPTGCIVVADKKSIINIFNTLNEDERRFISFNGDGVLNFSTPIGEIENPSDNLKSLFELSQSELTYKFKVDEVNPDTGEAFRDLSDEDYSRGLTSMPNSPVAPSEDGNVNITVGSTLTDKQQALTTAHEAYGHALLYERTRDASKALHDYGSELIGTEWNDEFQTKEPIFLKVDKNIVLDELIKKATFQVNSIFKRNRNF